WRRALCGFALRGRWPGADLSRPARGHHINHCNRTEPMSAAPGIAVNDITVAYRNGTTALKHASFTSPRGSITALVGVNGAGKSTIFKAIMGFVPVVSGSISILGETGQKAQRNNLVAYVPQAEEVDWNFPVLVEDVVMMGRFGHMNFLRMPR